MTFPHIIGRLRSLTGQLSTISVEQAELRSTRTVSNSTRDHATKQFPAVSDFGTLGATRRGFSGSKLTLLASNVRGPSCRSAGSRCELAAPCALGVFETMASTLPKNEDSIPARVQVSEVICRRRAEDIFIANTRAKNNGERCC